MKAAALHYKLDKDNAMIELEVIPGGLVEMLLRRGQNVSFGELRLAASVEKVASLCTAGMGDVGIVRQKDI